jgi:hypothetical protein
MWSYLLVILGSGLLGYIIGWWVGWGKAIEEIYETEDE